MNLEGMGFSSDDRDKDSERLNPDSSRKEPDPSRQPPRKQLDSSLGVDGKHKTDLQPELDPTVRQFCTTYPNIAEKIRTAIRTGEEIKIFFTDIDNTISIGRHGHTEAQFQQGLIDTKQLIEKLNDHNFIVIPITGTHYDKGTESTWSIRARIASGALPPIVAQGTRYGCDALVDAGGVNAYGPSSAENTYNRDKNYSEFIQASPETYKRVKRETENLARLVNGAIKLSPENYAIINSFDPKFVEQSQGRLVIVPQIAFKEHDHHQGSHKKAYYFYSRSLPQRDLIEQLFNRVVDKNAKVVCCEEKDANTKARALFGDKVKDGEFPLKYCLDITPVDKGTPVEYFLEKIKAVAQAVCQELGKDPKEVKIDAWFAGDAGNDINAARVDGISNVVFVNVSSPELLRFKPELELAGKVVHDSQEGGLGPASILKAIFQE